MQTHALSSAAKASAFCLFFRRYGKMTTPSFLLIFYDGGGKREFGYGAFE